MSQAFMGSPSKRKKSDHNADQLLLVSSPLPQNEPSAETPQSLGLPFSMENTPSFPAMELPIPSSSDWASDMKTAGLPVGSIFSPPGIGRGEYRPGSGLGTFRGIAATEFSPYSSLPVDYMDTETSSHLQRNKDALINKLEDLSRHTMNSNHSKPGVSSLASAAYEPVCISAAASSSGAPRLSGGSQTTSPDERVVHEDPFQQSSKTKALIITPSKKDRYRGLHLDTSEDMRQPSSQGSAMDGLLAAAEQQLPDGRHLAPNHAHSPVASGNRKKLKAKSPGRSLSKEGAFTMQQIRCGPLSESGGSVLSDSSGPARWSSSREPMSLFEQVQQSLSSVGSTDTTPVSRALNGELLQLDLRPADKKIVNCNCKKSRCLKMYCDCFRLTEYCKAGCNCLECANTPQFDAQRQFAIKSITDRNPEAFKPRVVEDAANSKGHLTGCHCRKSACLKKYCECFTAKVPCTDRCRCVECRNTSSLYSNARTALPASHPGNSLDGYSTLALPSAAQAQSSLLPAQPFRKTAAYPLSNIDHDRRGGVGSVSTSAGVLQERPALLTDAGETSLYHSAQQQMYSPIRQLGRSTLLSDLESSASPTKRLNAAPSSPLLSPVRGVLPELDSRPKFSGSEGVESSTLLKKKAISQAYNASTAASQTPTPPMAPMQLDMSAVYDVPMSPARPSSEKSVDAQLMSPSKLLELASLCEEQYELPASRIE